MRLRTFATGLSKNFTVPWDAWTSPREAFNVVDLPEPLGPTIQVIWPVGGCRLKPSMALTPRSDTCNFSISSTSVVMIGSFATLWHGPHQMVSVLRSYVAMLYSLTTWWVIT